MASSIVVLKIAATHRTNPLPSEKYLPPTTLGPTTPTTPTLGNSCLDNHPTLAPTDSLSRTLQEFFLCRAGIRPAGGGPTIANFIPLYRSDNNWSSNEILSKKATTFCAEDGMNPLSGNESSLLRCLGWLYDEGRVSGNSISN